MSVLGTTAQACRDTVRLKFAYTAGDGTATERYVEPYRLVAIGRRWYLVAFDIDRGDWRTFRLDRVNEPRPARTPFVPRPLPDDDPHRYVSQRIRDLTFVHRIVADVHMAPHDVTSGLGTWVTVTPTHSGSRVTFDADRLDWPLLQLASLGAPFSIVGPPELRATALHLARQLQLAAAGTADPSRADPVK